MQRRPVAQPSACDITIESNGSIAIAAASPIVTINSNNSLTIEGTISNTKTTGAVGVQIDTGFTDTTGFEDLGTIDLQSGTGTGKVGIELTVPAPTTAVPTPPTTPHGTDHFARFDHHHHRRPKHRRPDRQRRER